MNLLLRTESGTIEAEPASSAYFYRGGGGYGPMRPVLVVRIAGEERSPGAIGLSPIEAEAFAHALLAWARSQPGAKP